MASNTLTATAYDATFGAVTVTRRTDRPFTYAVVRVSDDGAVTGSFHETRAAADKAAGKPAPAVVIGGSVVVGAVRRYVVETRRKRQAPAPAAAAVQGGITEISADAGVGGIMLRELRRAAMVAWINADLLNRADCDVRKSIVLYDADAMFVMALGATVTPAVFRERVGLVSDSMSRAGIRFWSVGIG